MHALLTHGPDSMRLPLALLIPVLALMLAGPGAAQEFSSLEERMSQSEFAGAGLDKLSPQELETLNAWLRRELTTTTTAATTAALIKNKTDRLGFDRGGVFGSREAEGTIVSRVAGEFQGWNRKGQRFTLENGQVWETLDASSPLSVRLTNPQVTLSSGLVGTWFLQVEGYNTRVKVKRVK